ncbi:integrase, partial [Salmonella enterica subsp. enterica]|nr:integrase [Salmonella enterica subsp. enterica]
MFWSLTLAVMALSLKYRSTAFSNPSGLRLPMNDFREAIVEGRITTNPVEPTRAPEIKVARERLQLETYNATRAAAEHMPAWFPLAMDLALVTGQRREDIVNMKFSDDFDNRLYVTQIKAGMKIAIPLSLTLQATGLRLGTVIDRCRLVSRTDFM